MALVTSEPFTRRRPVIDAHYTADRRLYLDKDGNVVERDNPARIRLLVPVGGQIPMARARALGLVRDEDAPPEADRLDLTTQATDALIAAGYDTAEKVIAASDEELLAVNGVGEATLAMVRAAAAFLVALPSHQRVNATVADVLGYAASVDDQAEIERLLDVERRQAKPRATLIDGLEKRLAELRESDEAAEDADEEDETVKAQATGKAVQAPPANKAVSIPTPSTSTTAAAPGAKSDPAKG